MFIGYLGRRGTSIKGLKVMFVTPLASQVGWGGRAVLKEAYLVGLSCLPCPKFGKKIGNATLPGYILPQSSSSPQSACFRVTHSGQGPCSGSVCSGYQGLSSWCLSFPPM